MASVVESVDVEVPVSVAYDQWTQFEDFPYFMTGVEAVVQVDDRRLHWEVTVDGVQRGFDAEITEQHPGERVAWCTADRSHAGVVTFHRLSEQASRVSVQLDWAPHGFAEHVGAMIGRDDRQVKKDLERFKEYIEERGRATGAWRGDIDPAGR
jgi:uncharacterized membrane protein